MPRISTRAREYEAFRRRQLSSQKKASKLTGYPICRPNEIIREGYVRSGYKRVNGTVVKKVIVPPSCIKARGMARITGRKGKKVIKAVIRKGTLTECGYRVDLSESKRQAAIGRCIKQFKKTPLELFRKLNLVAILQKNTNPNHARVFLSDRNYIRERYM